jgi:hypothetical protein
VRHAAFDGDPDPGERGVEFSLVFGQVNPRFLLMGRFTASGSRSYPRSPRAWPVLEQFHPPGLTQAVDVVPACPARHGDGAAGCTRPGGSAMMMRRAWFLLC